jgi:hypothetical protein
MYFHFLLQILLPTQVIAGSGLALDLLWSDPRVNVPYNFYSYLVKSILQGMVNGFVWNEMRECSVFFGEGEVKKICERHDLDIIIRGHQAMRNGFNFFANRRLATLFSAPGYLLPDNNNFGGVIRITKNLELSVIMIHRVSFPFSLNY